MNGSKDKFFSLFTMCRKAGRMAMGFDAVKDSLLGKKAAAVFLASDISAKTEKEIRFFADKAGVPVTMLPMTISEIELGAGKKAGVIGICDEGFAKGLTEIASS